MNVRQLLVFAFPGLAAMILFAAPADDALAASANGKACSSNSDCRSGQCAPGPSLRPDQPGPRYCLHRQRACAMPGKGGGKLGQTITFKGQKLVCAKPSQYGWGNLPAQFMLPKGPTATTSPSSPTTGGIAGPGYTLWELNPPAKSRFPHGRTITAKLVTGLTSSVRFLWNCQSSTDHKEEIVVPTQQAQTVYGYPSYAAVSQFTPRDGATPTERTCTSSGAFVTLQAFYAATGKQIGNFIWYLDYLK